MKISVVTASYNSIDTIEDCIKSVQAQINANFEHIIIDGDSNDGSKEILNSFANSSKNLTVVSEPDSGIYDAMNKGIALATGDVIAILNADDKYASQNILNKVSLCMSKDKSIKMLLTDIEFFIQKDGKDKRSRKVRARWFLPKRLKYGWMPPHPGMFISKYVYMEEGIYDTSFQIGADYEFCVRIFLNKKYQYKIANFTSVKMRHGGISTNSFKSTIIITKEIIKSCKIHGHKPNYFLLILRLPIKKVLKMLDENTLFRKLITSNK